MQLVDGSSDVHAVGGAVSSTSYSSLLVPLPFSTGLLASKPAVRPLPDYSHLPALSPLNVAGVRRGLIACLECEYCLALLLASVRLEVAILLYKYLLYILRCLYY